MLTWCDIPEERLHFAEAAVASLFAGEPLGAGTSEDSCSQDPYHERLDHDHGR